MSSFDDPEIAFEDMKQERDTLREQVATLRHRVGSLETERDHLTEQVREKIAIKEAVKDIGGDNASVIDRVRHLAKLYRDAADETHDGAVAIYERLRKSPIRCRPLRIDGNVREMGQDVVSFIDAAEKLVEGRDVVSLATLHRVEAERDTLREQVATLQKRLDEKYEQVLADVEQRGGIIEAVERALKGDHVVYASDRVTKAMATIATLTAERDAARTKATAAADLAMGAYAEIERLTKERDQHAIDLDVAVTMVKNAKEQAFVYLAAIETLRAFAQRSDELNSLDAAKLRVSVLAATADYAKKAGEVEPCEHKRNAKSVPRQAWVCLDCGVDIVTFQKAGAR